VNQFADQLRTRVLEAREARDAAAAQGDSYLADVRTGELDSLLRMAADHGVLIDADEVGRHDSGVR
jgi:hypothetical protein